MKNIALAIIEVMKEVRGMERNSRVGGNTKNAYNGTKDSDVKEVFNDAMSKNGLCMIPFDIKEDTQVDRWEADDPWSKKNPKERKMFQSVFTKVTVKYTLVHSSGETMTVCGYGHGVDPQDKGAGKATTYAMKNALLYTFMTPVGKIDDTENTHSENIETPVKSQEELAFELVEASKTEEQLKNNWGSLSKDMKLLTTACKNKMKLKLETNK